MYDVVHYHDYRYSTVEYTLSPLLPKHLTSMTAQ